MMSSYFDEKSGRVHDIAVQSRTAEAFLDPLAVIEAEVIAEVTLNAGDREFPSDLRERILAVIATQRVESVVPDVPTKGRRMAEIGLYSPLIEDLHSLYHEVAHRRISVRNGAFTWLDDPRANNQLRDEVDQ
jgi:hypothetical protein